MESTNQQFKTADQIKTKRKISDYVYTVVFSIISLFWVYPLFMVLYNAFKKKATIIPHPFDLPSSDNFVGIDNFVQAVSNSATGLGFFGALFTSVIVTVLSVGLILLCTSMSAYYVARVKTWYTAIFYYLCLFSMIVPFQMIMYPLTVITDQFKLNNPINISIVYLGFGAGTAMFMFSNFLKSLPLEIEEAAMIDGCGPIRSFFYVVMPIMKPTIISVGILETMWIWNDFLLPSLVLAKEYKTVPIIIQYFNSGRGQTEWGAVMASMVITITPIVIIYFCLQKYIIKGVLSGAVKG